MKGLSLLWAAATGALLLMPGSRLPGARLTEPWVTAIELAIHFVLFFGLSWLSVRGFSPGPRTPDDSDLPRLRRRRVLTVVLAYCVLLEILQIAVPGRGFELIDIAAGSLGSLLGFWKRV